MTLARLTYRDLTPAGDREIALPAQDKGHRDELAAWARAIRGEGPPPNGLSQALRAALISFRVLDSLATGLPATIDAAEYAVGRGGASCGVACGERLG